MAIPGDSTDIICYTVPISTTVNQYNVRQKDLGIGGFTFKDVDGNIYSPCTDGCPDSLAYTDYQQLLGPIIGFRALINTPNDNDAFINTPVEVYIIYNSCPCQSSTFSGGIAPSDMTAYVNGLGAVS